MSICKIKNKKIYMMRLENEIIINLEDFRLNFHHLGFVNNRLFFVSFNRNL